MAYWSLETSKRAIVAGGALAMAYTQLTTSPATVEYARSLGAEGVHVGILGALPTGLFFMQFLSALVVNHLRFRRPIWFWTAIVQRLTFLPLAFGPWLWPEAADITWVWVLIGAAALNHGLTHFGSPLWLSWMGDYLPARGLSRFWGVRHLWQQWLAAGSLFGGAFVFWGAGLEMKSAYAVLMIAASVLGVIDILLFLKIDEPPVRPSPQPSLRSVLAAPFRDRQYRSFIQYACFWHFASMVGAPFIALYLLEEVGMSLFAVLTLWGISWIGGALLARRLGELVEDYGNRPVLVLCTTLKAANMLALLLVPADPTVAFLLLIPVLMIDAQLNAGINIANTGYMLKHSPQENRTMFIAAGTAMAGMVGGLTAIVAGVVLSELGDWRFTAGRFAFGGFHLLFAASLVLRIAAIGFARRVQEPRALPTRDAWQSLLSSLTLRLRGLTQAMRILPPPSLESDVEKTTAKSPQGVA